MLKNLVYHLKRLVPWVSSQKEPTEKPHTDIKYFPTRTHDADLHGVIIGDDIGHDLPMTLRDCPYAREGEVVTCENGHPICEFVKTVYVGDMQDPENQLGFWHQPKPEVGQIPIPRCAKCNGRFYISGGVMHFKNGWRDPFGYIEKFGFPEE